MDKESILTSTKKQLNIDEFDESFDLDILAAINTCISVLHQIGLGDGPALVVTDKSTTWDQLIPSPSLNMVKTYIFLKSKLIFDTPASGIATNSHKDILAEMEWRIEVACRQLKEQEDLK